MREKLIPESRGWLADELDKAADALTADAHDLDGRFAPQHHEAAAARKLAAAADVRAYAEKTRAEQGDMTPREHARGKVMAKAAQMSGILSDSPVPERTWGFSDEDYGAASLKPWAEDNAVKNSLVASGDMVRVAEGGQLPFFALKAYGGATWEETGRDGPPAHIDGGVQEYREREERAREAGHEAVRMAGEGSDWTSAVKQSGLDAYREPDRWALEKRAAAEAGASAERTDDNADGCEP